MKAIEFKIIENINIAKDIYRLKLEGYTDDISRSGQFVNLTIDGEYLRRPISICDWEENKLTLIYKVVGRGTEKLSKYPVGKLINTLIPLGNGFDETMCKDKPLLIGGGVGIPPLYGLAKKIKEFNPNAEITVVLGFNKEEEVFLKEDFEELGAKVYVTTVDGSVGTKGFVTDVVNEIEASYFYTCGPMAMFKAVETVVKTSGQYSFEERMGCGFGACMGCSCKTKYGNKRICKDGPVLQREEIIW